MEQIVPMQSLGTNATEIGLQPPVRPDRRRRVRHKIQLPAYVTLGETDTALDLSEIVNLSEDGMAIQTSSPLKVDERTTFVLDLPETNTKIRTDGKVVWAGSSGRVGIAFAGMPRHLSFELKKWLFANAVAGWVHHAAEVSESSQTAQTSPEAATAAIPQHFETSSAADHTALLTGLEAVKREIEALGTDLDAALYLISRRAQAFTRAGSAALALTEGEDMVCRATFGPSAPSVGAHLKVGSGFSGECVRTGLLLRCDDSESDIRVDRESCRYLGIRSMIATPVRWDVSIIGLLEVFSSEPNAFSADADLVLSRLAEITAEAVHRAGSVEEQADASPASVTDEFVAEEGSPVSLKRFYRSRNLLLFIAGLTVLVVALWVIMTSGNRSSQESVPSTPSTTLPGSSATAATVPDSLPALRHLADQGDPTAEFAIGARYATGEEVPQDYAQAVRWFTKAAEQGQVAAQATLGAYYWAGRGVAPDLMRAYFWSFLAEAGGDEASRSRVALLASRLTRAQIVAAQKQANEWFKQHQMTGKPSPEIR
ncbi:MAG: GAF domain-containing protein [Acidobacteriaceae bacterium]|nr:GAF domain-containing protein [Acidobacteriaceae bacterium]